MTMTPPSLQASSIPAFSSLHPSLRARALAVQQGVSRLVQELEEEGTNIDLHLSRAVLNMTLSIVTGMGWDVPVGDHKRIMCDIYAQCGIASSTAKPILNSLFSSYETGSVSAHGAALPSPRPLGAPQTQRSPVVSNLEAAQQSPESELSRLSTLHAQTICEKNSEIDILKELGEQNHKLLSRNIVEIKKLKT